jgi:hypothetical protein
MRLVISAAPNNKCHGDSTGNPKEKNDHFERFPPPNPMLQERRADGRSQKGWGKALEVIIFFFGVSCRVSMAFIVGSS